ncbi:HD-GYP domain-containing protein [Paenibacillus hemerocallicola]|uniref:HD-GYP domain-containing protein n=1 Tax=Paenibacillus hemerocallicola TaxID=1172614 RepID=A0A5C4T1J8_9BACL|nr:HD-GYP domain-containing protein [Paenibacillus hemerocallicola]TNJ62685.1 HD-GYP domain-containing protein [Paenibacillus hemerocallicola]
MRCDQYEDLIGKRLLHNIVNATGMMLIPENTVLTEGHIEKLEKFRINLYDILVEEVKETEELVELSEPEGQRQAENPAEPDSLNAARGKAGTAVIARADTGELVKRADAKLRDIERLILNTGKIPLTEVEEHVLPTLMEATQNRNVYKLFADLRAEEDYRFKHSIGVAFMSAVLGRWLGMDEKEVALLATAASLCDIGTIKLPSSLVNKTSELLPHEHEIMKQHTTLGYDMLKQSGVEERVAIVALQHHEREDGSGYPAKLKGPEIDRFGKIVALSDVYLALVSERPQRPALPFHQVIHNLHGDIVRNRFDSAIGMTFLNRLMSAQVGSDVMLTDGRKGKIVLIHPNYPTRPLIALEDGFIDLSKTDSVQMKEVFG